MRNRNEVHSCRYLWKGVVPGSGLKWPVDFAPTIVVLRRIVTRGFATCFIFAARAINFQTPRSYTLVSQQRSVVKSGMAETSAWFRK